MATITHPTPHKRGQSRPTLRPPLKIKDTYYDPADAHVHPRHPAGVLRRRFNDRMALRRRIYLDRDLVRNRSRRFTLVASLLGERLTKVIGGANKRADAVPLLLRLLEQTGENSGLMLERVERGLERFDALSPPGWTSWRASLSGARRTSFLSRYSELVLAQTFAEWGYVILGFGPTGAAGRVADLAVGVDDVEVLVEVVTPGPHENDWVDAAMDRLTFALSRVESGLCIDVKGFEALRFEPAGEWGTPNRKIETQEIEDLVNRFCRDAAHLIEELPAGIVEPNDDQPATITATGFLPGACDGTVVSSSWSRSGLVPDVDRLVEKILDERKHLPQDRATMVLVDLQRWEDFRSADRYIMDAAKALTGRTLPTVVGSFISDNAAGAIERSLLHVDETWLRTPAGTRFYADWPSHQLADPSCPDTGS